MDENISPIGNRIRLFYKNLNQSELDKISAKNKASKLKNWGDENYNNMEQNKKTKKERYGDENWNNRKKALETISKKSPEEKAIGIEKQTKKHYETFINRFIEKIKNHNVEYVRTEPNKDIVLRCTVCNKEIKHSRTTYNNILRFNRSFCSYCNDKYKTSSGEKELNEYICSLYKNKIERNNRKVLKGKEIDIYLPELNIGFEFNGTYWHMDERFYKPTDFNKPKNKTAEEIWLYDNQKIKLAEEEGIKLIQIKQYDWETNKDFVKQQIKELLGDLWMN